MQHEREMNTETRSPQNHIESNQTEIQTTLNSRQRGEQAHEAHQQPKIKQRVYFINFAFITFTHTHNWYLWQNDSYAACILNAISFSYILAGSCSGW